MTYNLIRDYPELNSPDHIFQEWQCLSEKKAPIPPNQSFTKISSDNQLEDAKVQLSCEFNLINNMITSGDAKSLYPSLLSLNDQIFDFVFEFNSIQSIKAVKELVNQSSKSSMQARNLVSSIKSSSEKVLFKLSLLKNHSEFLANPKLPHPNYWHLLNSLLHELYDFLMALIKNIQQFSSSFIPVEKIVMSGNPDLSSSSIEFFSATQSQSQFLPLENNNSSAVFYPTLIPLPNSQIPLNNRNNQNVRYSKYTEPIQKMLQLTKKLQQIKNPKTDDFTNIITTLCELNNLKNVFLEMFSKVHSIKQETLSSIVNLNIRDIEKMNDNKEKLEIKITDAAQRENSRKFNQYQNDYVTTVEQLLNIFQKCL